MDSTSNIIRAKVCKPLVPEKNFRLLGGRVAYIKDKTIYVESMKSELNEYWDKKQRERLISDSNYNCHKITQNSDTKFQKSETNTLSKTESITEEFLSYIEQVHNCLNYLMAVKEKLDDEFANDNITIKSICNVFRDIQALQSAYFMIKETIARLKSSHSNTFYLYDVILDPVVCNLLKMYKPFLNNYGAIIKWTTEFNRDNANFEALCERIRRDSDNIGNSTLDNCLYTVFNSLFSIELMFDRYRKCFDETCKEFQMATDAKDLISNILKLMNQNQDQESFMTTQKELSFLTGRSRESRVNTRFIIKGVVTKLSRRDDKRMSRQLVLFTDCLYVTLLPSNLLGTSSVRQEISVQSMRVTEINEDNEASGNMQWGLTINGKEAIQDYYFDNEHTMHIWRDSLLSVITVHGRADSGESSYTTSSLESLGLEAPRWQKDNAAGYCNGHRCCHKFSAATRRHHCRADGLLYCDSCCSFKVQLEFERSTESRVCELCYNILFLYRDNEEELYNSRRQLQEVIDRKMHTGSKSGWLKMKTYNREKVAFSSSVKYFCELEIQDPVLKLYEKREDKYHYDKIWLTEVQIADTKNSKYFILEDNARCPLYHMTAISEEDCLSWINCLNERTGLCFKD